MFLGYFVHDALRLTWQNKTIQKALHNFDENLLHKNIFNQVTTNIFFTEKRVKNTFQRKTF